MWYTYLDEKKRKRFRKKTETDTFCFVSPYKLIYSDDNYYLLAYDSLDRKPKMKHFRVDKMGSVSVLFTRHGETHSKVIVSAALNDDFCACVFSLGKRIRIAAPQMNKMLEDVTSKYHDVKKCLRRNDICQTSALIAKDLLACSQVIIKFTLNHHILCVTSAIMSLELQPTE